MIFPYISQNVAYFLNFKKLGPNTVLKLGVRALQVFNDLVIYHWSYSSVSVLYFRRQTLSVVALWPPPCLWYWWWWLPSSQWSPLDCPEGQETDGSDSLQRFHGVRGGWKRTFCVNDGGDPCCFIAFGMMIVVNEKLMKTECVCWEKWMYLQWSLKMNDIILCV